MSKVTRTIMMRKTKTVLIDMLEEQRQLIAKANIETDRQKALLANEFIRYASLNKRFEHREAKYEHLKTKHSDLNVKLGSKDREINQLKDAYIDKLELIVELYEGKV